MFKVSFKEGENHPLEHTKHPNFSLEQIVLDEVLSRFGDPALMLHYWMSKTKKGSTITIVDFDLDEVCRMSFSGEKHPGEIRSFLYGDQFHSRRSMLRYEEVLDIGKQLGLVVNTVKINAPRFVVEFIHASSN